jgi:Tfp pilus assembly protein PilW
MIMANPYLPRATPLRGVRAYTLVELMVAMAISTMILGVVMAFINFASMTMSGITAQSAVNEQAAGALQLIQNRARLATMVTNDNSGSTLTFGFDDNYGVDSNGDKLPYNDTDHLEKFRVIGTSTNLATSTNSLVYISANGYQKVLIPTGVCKLPGRNIFTVTNQATALIRFAVVDTYARNRYQSIDIQSAAVILNRRFSTNTITILP